MQPAIVIVAYNRPQSLKRLLLSINNGVYEAADIPLVISIDYKNSELHNEVVKVANEFNWKFGEKIVYEHKVNLGLRKHVLSCGDLTDKYEAIIMLEDDLMVSPHFYTFTQKALTFYQTDANIGGIALYSHKINFCNGLPFELIAEYADVFFLQIASSWGQAWTKQQWTEFRTWYGTDPVIKPSDKLPDAIKNWPESSWLKYFIKYLAENDKYFVYPKNAYTTNFGDSGTHNLNRNAVFQVALSVDDPGEFRFPALAASLNSYDSYFELKPAVVKRLNANLVKYDFVVDLYGLKDLNLFEEEFAISSKSLNQGSAVQTFDIAVKPMPMNLSSISGGNHFALALRVDFYHSVSPFIIDSYKWGYFWGRSNVKNMLKVLKEEISIKWHNKIKRLK